MVEIVVIVGLTLLVVVMSLFIASLNMSILNGKYEIKDYQSQIHFHEKHIEDLQYHLKQYKDEYEWLKLQDGIDELNKTVPGPIPHEVSNWCASLEHMPKRAVVDEHSLYIGGIKE